jgi:RNA polymerase sigma-70 factor (ECF subfamily)
MKQAYFIALGLVGNREDALDLSQEAFFRAYCNIKRLNPRCKFFPWFYQILRNLCFSHLRKKTHRQNCSLEELSDEKVVRRTGESFAPEVAVEKNEAKVQIWQAIGRLDNKHREVIILRHFRGMSYDEISKALFCSKGTVMSRLYYARKNLKEMLDEEKGGRRE